ncbi:alpha-1,2 glucosyltransferas-like protein alg10 [Ophiobolus disseminans]|uniref:Dol-P-Glc:Glc(2)Man(9)GlcNAc(2)-PP-Dol alpha-1,2-glucosyltransferase n=1 Tax=Ophiobolus disseminans TaxID=1469910 RepID=A0A6A7AL74_9PLEO|nr:alpha-1,2 glucosyltransferas-like protein alg10 [Ophiobolus disseminans]
MPTLLQTWGLPAALLVVVNFSTTWYNAVSKHVPEPYLDEFFHVPQAQLYCKGDYTWDPKITTPPGLYLVAKLFSPLIGCDTSSLRALNVGALCLICPLAYSILRFLRTGPNQRTNDSQAMKERTLANDPTITLDANTAMNISLFPPLFFFSALFYTDVISTLVVLLSYSALLRKTSAHGSTFDTFNAIIVGVVALFFRQTNIFWVAVFPAALSVVNALKSSTPSFSSARAATIGDIVRTSWNEAIVYDCSVEEAGFQDYFILLLSVSLAALRKPFLVLRVAFPYLTLLGLFVGFVFWNGSVVLGDKSAHTATIHTPQMLYIWPYIAFFSAPLLLGPVLQAVTKFLPKRLQKRYGNTNFLSRIWTVSDVFTSSLFVIGAFSAVHFNTIIHPYTLADNRHYVFYVFRILRQHPAIRYLAVPIYYIGAWLALQSLGATPNDEHALRQERDNARPTSAKSERSPCQISFIAIWLGTTALSVVTAPLVEPRYFIVPWIIWRLHVPSLPASLTSRGQFNTRAYDLRLAFETLWLLAIDAAVTYIFIYWGFAWPNEPDKVQRFLW